MLTGDVNAISPNFKPLPSTFYITVPNKASKQLLGVMGKRVHVVCILSPMAEKMTVGKNMRIDVHTPPPYRPQYAPPFPKDLARIWLNSMYKIKSTLPKLVSMCLSSAIEINPFPSRSKWERPSTKCSGVYFSPFLLLSWYMGRNSSNDMRVSKFVSSRL